MKSLGLIPLISILTACVSSPTPATPIQIIETATVVPGTKTAVPINTTEPTPTKDPSIPEGYMKDSSGNYTKTENGVTITWDSERKSGYSLMFDDFLWDISPELEYEVNFGNTNYTYKDQLELMVFIDSAITNWDKLSVTHHENMDPPLTINWTVIFQNFLWDEMAWRGLIKDKPDFDDEKWYTTNDYTIHYNTKEGPQTLILKDGNVTTVHIRSDYEALKGDQENNNFTEADGDNLGRPSIKYMVKISSDKDGNTYVEMAPNITDALQWSDMRIVEMFLFGYSAALGIPDEILIPRATSFSSNLAKNHASHPYFIFTRVK